MWHPQKMEPTLIGDILANSKNVLLTTESTLKDVNKTSLRQCRKMKQAAAKILFPINLTPASDFPRSEKWTTGCTELDVALRGGFPVQGLTELSGESATGKTQLCLQLCLTAQWPQSCNGLDAGAVYICTEDPFPSKRLQQLTKSFRTPDNFSRASYGDNIYIEHAADVAALMACVDQRVPELMLRCRIRLIVLDSVAGVFRTHLHDDGAVNRANALRSLAKNLQRLAVQHRSAIVCVNQVSAVLEETGCGLKEVPAMGLCWANLAHTRLRLSKNYEGEHYLEALSSSELPSETKWPFKITASGIVSC